MRGEPAGDVYAVYLHKSYVGRAVAVEAAIVSNRIATALGLHDSLGGAYIPRIASK